MLNKKSLGQKKWVSYLYRTAQPFTLAMFPSWGIQQELVVQDLPATKVLTYYLLTSFITKKINFFFSS